MIEKLPRLYYLSDNDLKLLPEWAYFFMKLGQQLATVPNTNGRFVIGLAIPTRALACSLVTTGIALARVGTKNSIDDVQLQQILSLEPGTPVYVRTDNHRKLRGVVENFEEYDGKPYIFIRTAEFGKRGYLIDRYVSRITVSDRGVSLPKYQQTGRQIETPSEFLQGCLGKQLAKEYILDSSFETLIIGRVSVIQHEVCEIPFIYKTSNKAINITGYLQEIIRVRQFSGANQSYRSQCVPSSSDTPEKEFGEHEPPIIIFDSAAAYLKHGYRWASAHQIALLDRTERQFADAIEVLNQNYAYRSADDFKFPINIPTGIEMTIYKERK